MSSLGRRVKVVSISGDLVCNLFRAGHSIRNARWSYEGQNVELMVESGHFEPVADGEVPPFVMPLFKAEET